MNTNIIIQALKNIKEAQKNGLHCFEIIGAEAGETFSLFDVFPREIEHNGGEYEYVYALMEHEKELLSLQVGQSMYFQPVRDDNTTKAIVIRVA